MFEHDLGFIHHEVIEDDFVEIAKAGAPEVVEAFFALP